MLKKVWVPAIVVGLAAFFFSLAIFIGLAVTMEAIYPNALALGTILFIVISASAYFLARRTEQEHAERHPDQASDAL